MWWASPSSPPRRSERQPLAGRELDDVLAQRADAQLRPGEVLEDRHRAPGPPGRVAHAANGLGVLLERSMRVVQPRDVHPRFDHAHERVRLARGRPDGGDDLGAAHRRQRYRCARRPRGSVIVAVDARFARRSIDSCSVPHDPFPASEPRRASPTSAAASSGARCSPCTSRAAVGGARRGRGGARVRAQSRHGAVRPRRGLPRTAAGAAQGALTSGKCSAQCSRSASRTHARSSGLAARKRRAARAGARSALRRSPSARPAARTGARPPAARRPPWYTAARPSFRRRPRASGLTRDGRRA